METNASEPERLRPWPGPVGASQPWHIEDDSVESDALVLGNEDLDDAWDDDDLGTLQLAACAAPKTHVLLVDAGLCCARLPVAFFLTSPACLSHGSRIRPFHMHVGGGCTRCKRTPTRRARPRLGAACPPAGKTAVTTSGIRSKSCPHSFTYCYLDAGLSGQNTGGCVAVIVTRMTNQPYERGITTHHIVMHAAAGVNKRARCKSSMKQC
eukprot:363419-Chlamydomonas_euryale.AAC.7